MAKPNLESKRDHTRVERLTLAGLWSATWALSLSMACASPQSSQESTSGGMSVDDLPQGARDFCASWAERANAWCDWQDECCVENQSLGGPAIGNCRSGIEDCLQALVDILQQGDAEWLDFGVDGCLDLVVGDPPPAACSDLGAWPYRFRTGFSATFLEYPQCKVLIDGPGRAGESCESSWECGAFGHCFPIGAGFSEFECRDFGGTGTTCYFDQDCDADFFCASPALGGVLSECTSGTLGARCLTGNNCHQGLHCAGNDELSDIPGTCELQAALGEACEDESACAPGTWCDAGVCVDIKEDGEACGTDWQCNGKCLDGTCASLCGGT